MINTLVFLMRAFLPLIGRLLLVGTTGYYFLILLCSTGKSWMLITMIFFIAIQVFDWWINLIFNSVNDVGVRMVGGQLNEWIEMYWVAGPTLIFITSMVIPLWTMRNDIIAAQRSQVELGKSLENYRENYQGWAEFCTEISRFVGIQILNERVTPLESGFNIQEARNNFCESIRTLFSDPSVGEQLIIIVIVVGRWLLCYPNAFEQVMTYVLAASIDLIEFISSADMLKTNLLRTKEILMLVNVAYFTSMIQYCLNMDGTTYIDERLQLVQWSEAPLKIKCLIIKEAIFGTGVWALVLSVSTQDVMFLFIRSFSWFVHGETSFHTIFAMGKNFLMIFIQVFRSFLAIREYIVQRRFKRSAYESMQRFSVQNWDKKRVTRQSRYVNDQIGKLYVERGLLPPED